MSYHQGPHELRLAISSEAEALISDFCDGAYAEARRARKRQAVIPWRGIGAKLRCWSRAKRESAQRCSPGCSTRAVCIWLYAYPAFFT